MSRSRRWSRRSSLRKSRPTAVLNMRLRSLRKLEEFEIRTEDKNLRNELKGIKGVLASEPEQWSKVGEQVRKVRDLFGPKTPLGKRRTMFADAPEHDLAAIEEAFVEREPVTVVISDKGWGAHAERPCRRSLGADLQDRRQARFGVLRRDHVETAAVRHQRENSIRSMSPSCRAAAAMASRSGCSSTWIRTPPSCPLFVNKGGRKFLVASHEGQGFVVNEDDCVGNTRKGKQVLNVEMPNEACAIATVSGDTVAAIGTNHKMVIFPIDQVPEMARGRGVRLQKYTSAKLSDVATFESKAGLTWKDSSGRDQAMSWKELSDWRGNRADAGRLAHGLPKSNKFFARRGVGARLNS